jgi:hypothetical protein
MTGGFLSMPAFYSITSYPIVKISWRIKETWVSVLHRPQIMTRKLLSPWLETQSCVAETTINKKRHDGPYFRHTTSSIKHLHWKPQNYTGWSKSLCASADYSAKTCKNILNSFNHLPW